MKVVKYLQVSSSLVLVRKDTCGFYNIFSSSLTPWDLFRVPNQNHNQLR